MKEIRVSFCLYDFFILKIIWLPFSISPFLCPPSKHYQTPEPNWTHFNLTMTIQTRRKAIAFMKISNKNTSTTTTSPPQHIQLPKPNHFRWVSQYCKLIQIKNKSRLLTLQKQKAILAIDLLHNLTHLK